MSSAPLPTRSWWQQAAAVLIWPSFLFSAFGALSALQDLIPTLTRLSLITHAAIAAYRLAREQVWDGIQSAFAWVHIHVPDVPAYAKDAFVFSCLVLTALNFESLARFKTSFFLSVARDVSRILKRVWSGKKDSFRTLIYATPSWQNNLAYTLGALAFVALLYSSLRQWTGVFTGIWAIGLALAYGVLVVAWIWFGYWAYHHLKGIPPGTPKGMAIRIYITAVMILLFPFYMPIMLLLAGWRGVLISVTLVGALFGFDFFLRAVVDPMLVHPPAWLLQLVEADPSALR